MDEDLRGILDRILAAAARIGWPLDRALQAGLDAEAINRLSTSLPFPLPASLRTLYAWRNGAAPDAIVDRLFPEGRFLALEEAVSLYELSRSAAERAAKRSKVSPEILWGKNWFPVFGDDGDFYVTLLDASDVAPAGVFFVANEDRQLLPAFQTIGAMGEAIERRYESGAYRVNEEGRLEAVDGAELRTPTGIDPSQHEELEALVEQLATGTDKARVAAFKALNGMRDVRLLEPLQRIVMTGDDTAKCRALEVLRGLGTAQSWPIIAHALSDPNPFVRCEATGSLVGCPSEEAVPALMSALNDPEDMIKVRAASVLGALKAVVAVPMLLEYLASDHPGLRHVAVTALSRIGDKRAVPGLLVALKDSIAEIALGAAAALGHLRDPAAIGPLLEFIQSMNEQIVMDDQELAAACSRKGKSMAAAADLSREIHARQSRKIAEASIKRLQKIRV